MTQESTPSARGPTPAHPGGSVASSEAYQPSPLSVSVALTGSAIAWTVHLLVGYVVVAAWCSAGWNGGTLAIGVLTLVCALASAATGIHALRI